MIYLPLATVYQLSMVEEPFYIEQIDLIIDRLWKEIWRELGGLGFLLLILTHTLPTYAFIILLNHFQIHSLCLRCLEASSQTRIEVQAYTLQPCSWSQNSALLSAPHLSLQWVTRSMGINQDITKSLKVPSINKIFSTRLLARSNFLCLVYAIEQPADACLSRMIPQGTFQGTQCIHPTSLAWYFPPSSHHGNDPHGKNYTP
ncbi:hypothetical protein F5Y19DRAFT_341194 [Xylariaceae sp. FL1651]|nr:hypothetical protein F5Y19DRAFT_341194 [Xylariaceae sp. FL1651]